MENDNIAPEENNNLQVKNMLERDVVDKIIALRSCGWGVKSIAKELGISKRTSKNISIAASGKLQKGDRLNCLPASMIGWKKILNYMVEMLTYCASN